MQEKHEDTVDFEKMIIMLWQQKFVVMSSVLFFLLAALIFLKFEENKFKSIILIDVDNVPPLISQQKLLSEFENLFFSQEIFEDWQEKNENSIEYEDISKTIDVENYTYAKDFSQYLFEFNRRKNGQFYFSVHSNDASIIQQYFSYLSHVSDVYQRLIAERLKNTFQNLELRQNSSTYSENYLLDKYLAYELFNVKDKEGIGIFKIKFPTQPVKIYPKDKLVFMLSAVLGFLFGVVLSFFRCWIRKISGARTDN